ncbi:MAG TPA: hypothetical protein VI488_05530 [Candidatus Angelobacter sp.]
MAAYKRTRITIETEQILIIRRRSCTRQWCWECGRAVDMVDLEQAGALTGLARRRLRDCARTEKWHLAAAADGAPLVCLDSMLAAQRQARTDQD